MSLSLTRFALLTMAALTVAIAKADSPDWQLPKGQRGLCGKLVSYNRSTKVAVIMVESELAPLPHHAGYGSVRYGTADTDKKITINLSKAQMRKVKEVEDSQGDVSRVELPAAKWNNGALVVGKSLTVYVGLGKPGTLTATWVIADTP